MKRGTPYAHGDRGSGLLPYVALGALAAVILAGLVTAGVGTKLGTGAETVICRITGGAHCTRTTEDDTERAAEPGGAKPGGDDAGTTAPPTASTGDGTTPSLADLQRKADKAQKDLDGANDGTGVLKRIGHVLKDFLGVTDIEKCAGEGDFGACLRGAVDIGGMFFAALKARKFVGAVKDAVKLYRDYKDAKRAYQAFKSARQAARSRLERTSARCGVPLYGASLAAGTRVALAGGGTAPIEDIRVGDRVLAAHPGGRSRAERVLALNRGHGDRAFVRLRVSGNAYGVGGGTLTTTANHLFWSPGRRAWVEAGNLRVNERFGTSGGLTPRVVERRAFRAVRPVFNLTVSGPHTYFVHSGRARLLVHNDDTCGPDWAKVSDTLRSAAKGKGNYGLGSGTRAEADAAGRAWVGPDATLASDGKTLVSKDGLRQYRPPSHKPRLGKTQANLEQRREAKGQWQDNGHIDVTD